MIQLLPVSSISSDDQIELGLGPVHLGVLTRAKLPVPDGFVIVAPVKQVIEILKDLRIEDPLSLETQTKALNSQLNKLKLSASDQKLVNSKFFYFNGQIFNKLDKLWQSVLQAWLLEIQTSVHNNLKLQRLINPVIFQLQTEPSYKFVAFYDPGYQEIVIESDQKIPPKVMQKVDPIVLAANRRLILPQVYQFIVIKDQPCLVKIQPFTEGKFKTQTVVQQASPEKPKVVPNLQPRLALKVITELNNHYQFDPMTDGVIVSLDQMADESQIVSLLAELCQGINGKPVFCRLPKNLDPQLDAGLSLIQNHQLLDQIAKIFLTVHDKYFGHNLIMILPEVKSTKVFEQIKRHLSAREVVYKTDLKIWLEATVPENLINISQYLQLGLDGIILETDSLLANLTNASGLDAHFYGKNWQVLENFLTPYLAELRSKQIPILVKGQGSLAQEMLEFLISNGLWGVVLSQNNLEYEIDHLVWTEQKVILHR